MRCVSGVRCVAQEEGVRDADLRMISVMMNHFTFTQNSLDLSLTQIRRSFKTKIGIRDIIYTPL